MARENLKSRLGFILISAGCAIGIGNVWKFPYMAGKNGGGAFVLIYLIFLLIMGIPVMTMEFSLGRASRKSPVKIYDELAPKGTKWKYHGYLAMVGNFLLMMFYTTVAGWMVQYFVKMVKGDFSGLDTVGINNQFDGMMGDWKMMLIYTSIVVIAGFLVCSFSIQKGLERVTKVMMIALLVIMLVLALNSVFMEGGAEGLSFYLKPDFSKMKEVGVVNVIFDAMSQAFFTLSLGIGSMAIFGSYIGKDRALMGESVSIALLDTFVAITSGLIIFPACFAYGVQPDAGPPLIFKTLPNIFNNMSMGRLWGSLFFVFLTFAAFSTVIAVFENIMAMMMDLTGLSRRKTSLICCAAMLVLSVPCVLGFNVFSSFKPFGDNSSVLDIEDFIVSYILLPLGSLIFVLFCICKRYGWGWDNFVNEANTGKGLKVKKWMKGYMTCILPVLVAVFLVIGLISFFDKDFFKNFF